MSRIWGLLFFAANLAFIVFEWWRTSGALFALGPASVLLSLGRLAGLFAAYAVLTQLLIVSRAPFLEKAFGLDRLLRLHKWNGFFAFGNIIAHPVFVIFAYGLADRLGFFSEALRIITGYDDAFNALLGALLFIFLVVLTLNILKRHLRYETWYLVHITAYAAVLLAFGHQTSLGGDFTNPYFVLYWDALYTVIFALLIGYRFLRPAYVSWREAFRVTRIVPEGPEAVSIFVSGRNLERLHMEPGQFFILRFLQRGFWSEAHPFSVSRLPERNEMRFTAKIAGDFTARLKNLPAGSYTVLDGPYGTFIPRRASRDKFLLIAGGVGITPIYVLAKSLAERGRDVILLYGTGHPDSAILKDDVAALPGVRSHMVVSQHPEYPGEKGRIDLARIKRLAPDFASRDIYICGPHAMMRSLKKDLLGAGAARKTIHMEEFDFGLAATAANTAAGVR